MVEPEEALAENRASQWEKRNKKVSERIRLSDVVGGDERNSLFIRIESLRSTCDIGERRSTL